MATIKYQVLTKSDNATIYLRLSNGRGTTPRAKTGLSINYKDWSTKTALPKQNNANNKNLLYALQGLKSHILNKLNEANIKGVTINKNWLENCIEVFFNRKSENGINDNLIENINLILQNAKTKKNGKGNIGLSKTRINSYKVLKESLLEFKGNAIKVKDVNKKFADDFLNFLLNEKFYANSTALKRIADLKTACFEASYNGIEVSSQLRSIKTTKVKNDIPIYLNEEEIQKIKKLDLKNEKLLNAKKWLLVGCFIGQRGSDLLSITKKNIILIDDKEFIELTQKKTNKKVVIPILDEIKEIIKESFPYKISTQKFNDYIKEICKLAEINQLIEGSKTITVKDSFNNKVKRRVKGKYPKYELVASHICRRSFATNFYGKMPTYLIMKITSHSTERMFLNYIGKTSFDYAKEFEKYYNNQSTYT